MFFNTTLCSKSLLRSINSMNKPTVALERCDPYILETAKKAALESIQRQLCNITYIGMFSSVNRDVFC